MKSPLAAQTTDPENYSEIGVMHSAAGYYLGTYYNNPEGYREPGTRDSIRYWATAAEAKAALENGFTQREWF